MTVLSVTDDFHDVQLTESEVGELRSGVQGLEMRRQKSFHTIKQMKAKVGVAYFASRDHRGSRCGASQRCLV